jgi:hypothetical protein
MNTKLQGIAEKMDSQTNTVLFIIGLKFFLEDVNNPINLASSIIVADEKKEFEPLFNNINKCAKIDKNKMINKYLDLYKTISSLKCSENKQVKLKRAPFKCGEQLTLNPSYKNLVFSKYYKFIVYSKRRSKNNKLYYTIQCSLENNANSDYTFFELRSDEMHKQFIVKN